MRPIVFMGSSEKDLAKLASYVKDAFTFGLNVAAQGKQAVHAKILKGFGGGQVLELIEDYRTDTYRAVYTVKFKKAVYVLHVFKKKSTTGIETPKQDKELVKKRLKDASTHYKNNF